MFFTYAERKFEVKADTPEEINKWYETLNNLVEAQMKKERSVTVGSGSDKGFLY